MFPREGLGRVFGRALGRFWEGFWEGFGKGVGWVCECVGCVWDGYGRVGEGVGESLGRNH